MRRITLDTQSVELIGRNQLTAELLRAGLEVAMPLRDRGIDLIAYVDTGSDVSAFSAVPIQMKASSGSGFGINAKYDKFPNLLLAHVWGVQRSGSEATYALTHAESIAVGDAMGYTRTDSWTVHRAYATTKPSRKLLALLEPYRMTPEKWRAKVIGQLATSA